eukprot:1125947-Pyramimonas_sp.AAC.1
MKGNLTVSSLLAQASKIEQDPVKKREQQEQARQAEQSAKSTAAPPLERPAEAVKRAGGAWRDASL